MGRVRGGKKLDKLIRDAGKGVRRVRVGYLSDVDRYDDGTPVNVVAIAQEFGDPARRIPERPFFRGALREMQGDLRKTLRQGFKPETGGVDRETAERVGRVAVEHIRRSIDRLREPPNAPATLEQKAGDNPLIDTGRLKDGASFEVEGG